MSFYKTLDRIKKKSIIIINKDKRTGDIKMNTLKKMTSHDYTKWDIDCPFVHIYNKTELKKKITRKARRAMKQELKKMNCNEFQEIS